MSVRVPVALLVNVIGAIGCQIFGGIQSDGCAALLVLATVPVHWVSVEVQDFELGLLLKKRRYFLFKISQYPAL